MTKYESIQHIPIKAAQKEFELFEMQSAVCKSTCYQREVHIL
jgi:hypothetical protein